jgi:hypothetical protein
MRRRNLVVTRDDLLLDLSSPAGERDAPVDRPDNNRSRPRQHSRTSPLDDRRRSAPGTLDGRTVQMLDSGGSGPVEGKVAHSAVAFSGETR